MQQTIWDVCYSCLVAFYVRPPNRGSDSDPKRVRQIVALPDERSIKAGLQQSRKFIQFVVVNIHNVHANIYQVRQLPGFLS